MLSLFLLPSSVLVQLGWTELALLSLYPSGHPAGRPAIRPSAGFGLVWYGMVWVGMVLFDMNQNRFGRVWYDMVILDIII